MGALPSIPPRNSKSLGTEPVLLLAGSNGAAHRNWQITRSFNFPFLLLLEWQTPLLFLSWMPDVCCTQGGIQREEKISLGS